jgi:hypothetical protein
MLSEDKIPTVNVWTQIGAQVPHPHLLNLSPERFISMKALKKTLVSVSAKKQV